MATSIPGDETGPLAEGTSWEVIHNVSVTDGTLTANDPTININEFAGLAGIQLAAVPEPSEIALLVIGGIGALWRARKR